MSILYAVIYDTGIIGVVRYICLERATVVTAYRLNCIIKKDTKKEEINIT